MNCYKIYRWVNRRWQFWMYRNGKDEEDAIKRSGLLGRTRKCNIKAEFHA